jgi:NAD(P)-dependent dehydrogenase (short-subunit alcohol dehydrogenase family)
MENPRSVVVTGASTGIGKAIAQALHQSGFVVFEGVRKESDANALREAAGERFEPVLLDVTCKDSIARAAESVAKRTGGELYGLVNNAGVGLGGPLEIVPIEETRKLMDVNVIGLLAVTQAFLPLLRKGQGRIVNIGSLAGIVAMPGGSSYAASKFAVQAITDSLRLELAPVGVQVTIVDPGAIESALWDKGRTQKDAILHAAPPHLLEPYAPLIELGKQLGDNPRDILPASCVADDVLHALTAAKPKARYLVGPGPKKAAKLARMPVRIREWLIGNFLKSGVQRNAGQAPEAERTDPALAEQSGEQGVGR